MIVVVALFPGSRVWAQEPGNEVTIAVGAQLVFAVSVDGDKELISLMPSPKAPHGMKQSGKQSRITRHNILGEFVVPFGYRLLAEGTLGLPSG